MGMGMDMHYCQRAWVERAESLDARMSRYLHA